MSTEMSKANGVEYIRNQLVNGKLIMTEATEKTGWSFPRIRSRAMTICKKLGGTFVKAERGVYILEPVSKSEPGLIHNEHEHDAIPANDDDMDTRMAEAEAALLGDASNKERAE